MPPRDHFHDDGSVAVERLTSAGRPAPLVTVAIMGEDGSLRARGERGEDMVITGGFNVYSAEVEQALMAHEAVRDCAVIGLPDEKWGERVTAVVQLQPGAHAEGGELTAFVKARLGSVEAPKQIEIWPDLPRSTVGKVLKTEIRSALTSAN